MYDWNYRSGNHTAQVGCKGRNHTESAACVGESHAESRGWWKKEEKRFPLPSGSVNRVGGNHAETVETGMCMSWERRSPT